MHTKTILQNQADTISLHWHSTSHQTIRGKQDITREYEIRSVSHLMIIPDDLDIIQPRASQAWDYNEIGSDPNGNWNNIVCTYRWSNTG